jgi:formylglycine-generating enzyme
MQKQPIIYQLPGIPPIKMVHVPGGTFSMGYASSIHNPDHEVRLDDFHLCEFPVTQDLYEVVTRKNSSDFKGNRRPVECLNWYDAVEFCNLLSENLGMEKVYAIDKKTKIKTIKTKLMK